MQRVKLHHDKWTYKRQSEALEEGSMSAMQQMIQQQKERDQLREQMEERMKQKEAEEKKQLFYLVLIVC